MEELTFDDAASIATESDSELKQLNQRALTEYSESELKEIRKKTRQMLHQIDSVVEDHEIYENQTAAAVTLNNNLKNRSKLIQLAIGLTQSGKTGLMLAFLKQYLADQENQINPEHIFLITGLSSVEWLNQTKSRMPPIIHNNILHCGTIQRRLIQKLIGKKNIIILIDETHVACEIENQIGKAFRASKLYMRDYLMNFDVKIIEFSATPNGIIYDVKKWRDRADLVKMRPGAGYVGCADLLTMRRLRQYKPLIDLEGVENVEELKGVVDRMPRMYHIIRTVTGTRQDQQIKNFISVFSDKNRYAYVRYDEQNAKREINEILSTEPKRHTFIFVKEMFRCAKTLVTRFIGVCYDRYTDHVDDSVIIQGLLGRLTGYQYNGVSVCFTNIDSVKRYVKQWDTDFEDKKTVMRTSSTRRGESKGTHTSVEHFDLGSESDTEPEPEQNVEVKLFNSPAELNAWYRSVVCPLHHIQARSHPTKTITEGAFIKTYLRSGYKIATINEAVNISTSLLPTRDDRISLYSVGYEDLTDPDSVKHILVYKKRLFDI